MILFLILVIAAIAFFVGRAVHRSRIHRFHAHAEYWVYSDSTNFPNQELMMTRLVGDNPYIQKGQNPIGAAEGLLFSDIRLKIALVLRSKNPNLFLAEKLPESIPEHHDFVNDISGFQSLIKIQYASPTRLKDKRHLQFLIHVADAIAEICESEWIYDKVSGNLWPRKELQDVLSKNFVVTKPQFHVRLLHTDDETFQSFGLVKIGIPDFETHVVPYDQTSLVREVLEKYIALSWERGEAFPDPIKAYDDEFILLQKQTSPTHVEMRIVRKQMLN